MTPERAHELLELTAEESAWLRRLLDGEERIRSPKLRAFCYRMWRRGLVSLCCGEDRERMYASLTGQGRYVAETLRELL